MTFTLVHIAVKALQRMLLATIAAVALAAPSLWSTVAHAQANCPDPTHPDSGYNCPVGPVYVMPSLGNVPWLNPEYFQTIQTGDVDGDGVDDLIARDANGLHLYMYDASLGTWMPVLTTQGGDELVLKDFSDAAGWGVRESYYATIKVVKLAPNDTYLVGRAGQGLTVYEFQRGPDKEGFRTGSWKHVSENGPFGDTEGWWALPYGLSLRYGRYIDTTGFGVVVGWGKNGIETYQWNGSGWAKLANTPGFGDAAAHAAGVLSLQIANIDNTVAERLLVIGDKGLAAYAFVPNAGWQIAVSEPAGIFTRDAGCDAGTNTCAYTLQTASLEGEKNPVVIARRSVCSKKAAGMMGVELNPQNGQWRVVFTLGPFDDCPPDSFADVSHFSSIMAADIDGDGNDELIGRGANGILAYRWNMSTQRWSSMVTNVPALSDALWASDPAYWASLRTAKIDGSKHALLARGSAGMRTWLYDGNKSFARPKHYGNFPAVDPASYQAVNNFLRLPNGVRQSYTDGTTSAVMNTYITELSGICHNEIAANPVQFQQCDPRPDSQNPAFTATVNQLLRELSYAVAAGGYFDRVNQMQAQLFSQEGIEFPSIVDNLQLAQASQQTASMPYLTLFSNLLRALLPLAGPEAVVAGNLFGAALSAAPLFESKPASIKPQQYADIRATIASLQQQTQNTLSSTKQHVAGDYALLSGVGQLVSSQVWRLDEGAYLSASRYAFTQWVMQQLLPSLYERWEVYSCDPVVCVPPPAPPTGSNIYKYSKDPETGYVDFIGILQHPSYYITETLPCILVAVPGGVNTPYCRFDQMGLPPALQTLVFGPLTQQCIYTPGAGTGWVYPSPSNPGCSLQAGPAIFLNASGWTFFQRVCDVFGGEGEPDPC